MRGAAALALALLVAAPGASAQDDKRGPPRRHGHADPSAVLAADIALARLVQQKGQWWAWRKTADAEAQVFEPRRSEALAWLKGRDEPPVALRWQAQAVWASCDGEIAVTSGPWQVGDAAGAYATVWRRQPKKGDYRWLLTMRFANAAPAAPDMIPALVADCDGPRLGANAETALTAGDDSETTVSRDGSLRWTTTLRADGGRRFTLDARRDGQPALELDLAGTAPVP